MASEPTTNIYIDDVGVSVPSCRIVSTGLVTLGEGQPLWTYPGTKNFLGFSLTSGSTTPDNGYAVGDNFYPSNNVHYYAVDTITDLTGTTWEFNSQITQYANDGADINFTSDGVSYTYLRCVEEITTDMTYSSNSGGVAVYEDGYWFSEAYRTISIAGGTDATNATLIAWLEANATQVVVLPDPFTIIYNNSKIYGTSQDGTVTLPCANKVMASDITVTGLGVYNANINYNGSTITTASGTFTKTLSCANKIMSSDISIDVEVNAPDTYFVTFYITSGSGSVSESNPAYLATANGAKNWNGTLEYSYDKKHWTTWDGTTNINFDLDSLKIYMRGTNNTYLTGGSSNSSGAKKFIITTADSKIGYVTSYTCTGDIETLLDYNTVKSGSHPTKANYCFSGLFYGDTKLTDGPQLSGVGLSQYCYGHMFYGCTSLVNMPTFSITSVTTDGANNGRICQQMFYGCTSLVHIPTTNITVAPGYAYYQMYYNCSSLTELPTIIITEASGTYSIGAYAFRQMFAYASGYANNLVLYTSSASGRTAWKITNSASGTTGTTPGYRTIKVGTSTTTNLTIGTTYYTANTIVGS